MRKILSIALIFTIFIPFIQIKQTNAYSAEKFFIVTAYYSPLPNQTHYLKGNYAAEIRLNGHGIKGASGKSVTPGMLAAPKNYKFGTHIDLEGLGIGEVMDRGGAIVNAGKRGYPHDRIDIWMGYGETGLKRALAWGKRTVKGKILAGYKGKKTVNLNNFSAPNYVLNKLNKSKNIFAKGIGIRNHSSDVYPLQKFLKETGIYTGKIDGKYNAQLINQILAFQKKYGLMKGNYDYGAGYWGKATRSLVAKMYYRGDFKAKKTENKLVAKSSSIFDFNLGIGSDKNKVKELQKILTKIGIYKGNIDGNYHNIKTVIKNYQLKNKIIKSASNTGSGYFGPKTRSFIQKKYLATLKFEKEEIKRKEEEKAKYLAKLKEEEKRKKEVTNKVEKYIARIGHPKIGDISPAVRELQKTLKSLGYFKVKDSAIFGRVTKNSIIAYQIDKGLISKNTDKGAGVFGPNTKKQVKKDLIINILKTGEKNLSFLY